ncbi:MAG: thioredoxin:protein disulfide reductase [Abditibacteriota bacterium]|nr:thioredoxin:protein disulfide reductase [Abditibacteriota bacterium]
MEIHSRTNGLAGVLALSVALFVAIPSARAQFGMPSAPKDIVTATATLSPATLAPGGTATLRVQLKIKPPFHINANPASEEYLIATKVTVNKAPGLTAGKAVYPPALLKKFEFYDKKLRVYEGTTAISVPLKLVAGAKSPQSVAGVLDYQACNDTSCLPPAKVTFSSVAGATTNPSGNSASGTSQTPLNSSTSAANAGTLDADANVIRTQYGVVGLPALVFLDEKGNERTDLRAGEELTLPSMMQKMEALKSGEKLEVSEESAGGWLGRLKSAPFALQLLLVFIGGLLLNLTPCVYPMIPITVGYFGAQSEGRTGKTFGLAAVYVLGLALMYSALGVFAALTGGLFGATLQSPFVVGFVALVLFALSLSMFGLFTIQPPQFIMARSGAKKGTAGALAMGALLGIVAAPCVGPIVAALLTYVAAKSGELGKAQGALFGFTLFFTLALGLGVPYLLLGTFSGSIKSMPRSGPWLERLKKVFAVPLLIASLYYAYFAFKPATTASAAPIPAASATTETIRVTSGAAGERSEHVNWQPATLAAIEDAKRAGRPVVIDFRADWCLPCLKLEREVFERPEMVLASKDVVLLRADYTRAGR